MTLQNLSVFPPSPESDGDLMRRSLAEPSCFDIVFDRNVAAIFRFVAARVGPRLAEDVVAETFLTAFAIRHRFDAHATKARPWLYGIAANKLHQQREVERRWLTRCSLATVAAASSGREVNDTDDAVARLDARQLRPPLAEALLALSPMERDVLLLFALEGFGHQEIADALKIKVGTAKSHLHRARTQLQQVLLEQLDLNRGK